MILNECYIENRLHLFVRVNFLNQNKLQADSIYQIMYRKSIGGLFIGHNHVYCFRVNLVDLIAGGHVIKWRVWPWIAYNTGRETERNRKNEWSF